MGGIALVALGIVALVNTGDLKGAFKEHDPAFVAIILIVLGSIVFLISFFGCCGAIRESHCMTMTYASILLIIIIAQVVIGVLVIVQKDEFMDNIMKHIGNIWANPTAPGNTETITAIENSVGTKGFRNIQEL